MTFLHPWALAVGAAAVALPLAVHWLTRPRPVRLPLSTIRFVLEAVRQRRARHRLRDVLILLLRAAAVVLIAWAFARPLGAVKNPGATDAGADTARVVVLDQSQSTAAAVRGVSAFERARPVAARYLSGGPGARANLILAGARPRAVFEQVSSNLPALRDELASAQPRPERLNLQAAINRAAEMLAAAGTGGAARRELVVLSDFQRADWSSFDPSPLPKDTVIRLESVAPPQPPANVAVLRVAAAGRVEEGRESRVEVDVGNFSPAARQVQVDLLVGDATYRLDGLCPPGVSTTLSTTFVPRTAGWQTGEARLAGVEDALPADDARPFVLGVRTAPNYALVTRDDPKPRATSSHFLERALAPASDGRGVGGREARVAAGGAARVQRIDPKVLDRDALAGADLVVLDHPGKLSAESIQLLAALARRGRALLYVAAEPVDATNLKLLADAAGPDLKLPMNFLPPRPGQVRRGLFLAEVAKDQPPFREFGDALPAAVRPLRFAGGLGTERNPSGLSDDVQATFSDRTAFLVTTAWGAGSLAVLNAELGESNLPASPVFVPLVNELVARLLGRGRSEHAVACGERVDEYLPPEAGGASALKVSGPPGAVGSAAPQAADLGNVTDEGGFVLWHWPSAGAPGVYQVRRGDATVFALASAVPPTEADLTAIDPALLQGRLAGGRAVHFTQSASDAPELRDNTWAWVLAACVGCLLLETVALLAFKT
jgi:hypothetical protein